MGRGQEERKMKLSVITPERKLVVDREVEEVRLPTPAGYIGLLPHHFPVMGILGVGILSFGGEKIAVEGGFFRFEKETLEVLAKMAWKPEELSRKQLKEEKEKALQILRTSSDPQEVERAAYRFSRASAFLTLFQD